MNWNNMWNILFNRTELFGINMGFWVCLLVITIIVILMNVVFWSMKPLKTVEEQKNIKYYKLKKDLWYITAGLFELSSKNKKLKIVMIHKWVLQNIRKWQQDIMNCIPLKKRKNLLKIINISGR